MVPDSSGTLEALGTFKQLFLGPDTKDRQGQPAGTKDTEQSAQQMQERLSKGARGNVGLSGTQWGLYGVVSLREIFYRVSPSQAVLGPRSIPHWILTVTLQSK